MAARAWGARWPARSAKTSAPASSTRSSRATCASVRRPATGCPSRGMMRPALAATPTSISPRRSCLVREKKALGKGLGALIGEGRSTLGRAGGAGGEGRLREAGLAGLEYIPALVRPADEIASLEIALAENVAREDLNGIEEAQAYAALVDEFGLTHERVAELVGRSRVAVTNLLRLLELPDDVQLMIEQGELSEGHGRALLALPDHGQRRKVARLVASQGLSVRQTEALVKKLNEEAPGGAAPAARPPAGADFSDLVDELYGLLETPV